MQVKPRRPRKATQHVVVGRTGGRQWTRDANHHVMVAYPGGVVDYPDGPEHLYKPYHFVVVALSRWFKTLSKS